jgi:hypothetical protein
MRRKTQPKVGWNDEISDTPQRPVPSTTPDQVQREIAEATKEATERVGMSGALGNVKAGGIRIDTAGGVNAYQGGDRKTSIEPDGDFFAGSNINIPAGTSFIVFAIAQDWNGEAMEEGDILIGDNSDDTSNIKWDASEGQWQFRLGTTVNVYMDTDGKIYSGGGATWQDVSGISVLVTSDINGEASRAYKFVDTDGNIVAWLYDYYPAGDNFLFTAVKPITGRNSTLFLTADAPTGEYAQSTMQAAQAGGGTANLNLYANNDGTTTIDATADEIRLYGELYLDDVSLSPAAAEADINNVFGVTSPGGPSLFIATINGAPSGTSVVYNAPSSGTEGVLVPTANTQLAKLRLYNTTRGNSALISDCNVGTNTITLTANAPANWVNGDTITVASQTVSGGGFNWVDLEIINGPTGKSGLFCTILLTSGAASDAAYCHPFDTFGGGKRTPRAITQVAGVQVAAFGLVPVTGNVFSFAWTAASSQVTIAEAGTIA